VDNV